MSWWPDNPFHYQGVKGLEGPAGSTGSTGATGPTGPQGPSAPLYTRLFQSSAGNGLSITYLSTGVAATFPVSPQIAITYNAPLFTAIPAASNWILTMSWFQATATAMTGMYYYATYTVNGGSLPGSPFGQMAANAAFASSGGGANQLAYYAGNGAIFGFTPTNASTITIYFWIRSATATAGTLISSPAPFVIASLSASQ